MKLKLLQTLFGFIPALVLAQSTPNMLGTWNGASNSAVYGSGLFHPTEVSKENSVRFRSVEYMLIIDKEEGRNFSGLIGATNKKHKTDIKRKEMIVGSYAMDMKNGVMVNENGAFSFRLLESKLLEVCYTQVKSPIVASCFEMTKQ